MRALSEVKKDLQQRPQRWGIIDDRLRMQSSASFKEIVTPGNKYDIPRWWRGPATKLEQPAARSPGKKEKRTRVCRISMHCGQNDDCIPSGLCGHRASGGAVEAAIRFICPTQRFSTLLLVLDSNAPEGMVDDSLY